MGMTIDEAIAYGKRVIDLGLNDETQAFCELAIKALEQEPCEDTISREDALMCMTGEYIADMTCTPEDIISKHIQRLRSLPPVTPQETRWTPVSERLPIIGEDVLICDYDGDMYISYLHTDGKWGYDYSGIKLKNIMAWMPLPTPYEPQEDKKNE
jgi:hypothetical protein